MTYARGRVDFPAPRDAWSERPSPGCHRRLAARYPVRMLWLCTLLATALSGAAPAHAPAAADAPWAAVAGQDIAALVARLRDPKLSIDERESLQAQLLALGEDGARALQRYVEEGYDKLDKRVATRERRYASDFERAAQKLLESRLTRDAFKEIDKLRGEIAKLRADAALTKERIHEVGDPALQRLKELLDLTADDVFVSVPELVAARQALGDDTFELEESFKLWRRCNEALPEKKRSKALTDPAARWIALEAGEQLACLLATPMSAGDRDVLARNRTLVAELDPEEAAGILDLNRLRIRLGLNALAIDLKLCEAARDHSGDMRVLGFFAHESPVEGKKTPWDRAARFGTSCSAENIAAGQSTGPDANIGWWYSPGHHKNMLGGHARIGLGRSDTFWTQMFG